MVKRNVRNPSIVLVALLLGILLLSGCGKPELFAGAYRKEFPFQIVKSGINGFVFSADGPHLRVFRSRDEFKEFWDKATSEGLMAEGGPMGLVDPDPYGMELTPIIDPVNFETQMVVGVFMQGSSRGDTVAIKSIRRVGDKVVVQVDHRTDTKTNFENVAPYQIAVVEGNPDLPVTFDVNEK